VVSRDIGKLWTYGLGAFLCQLRPRTWCFGGQGWDGVGVLRWLGTSWATASSPA